MNNNRYIRHYSVPHFGNVGQEKLARSTVAVVGAGGLGCPVLMQLAGAGIGKLIIIEHDKVEESNLSRQQLYSLADVGRMKAEAANEHLLRLNPDVKIEIHQVKLTAQNALELLAIADLILDCSDNFSTRYLINDACVILGKPWVFGAIESWDGQFAVFNHPDGTGPTYRCIFPEYPEDAADCNTAGVLPPLPSYIGTCMANEAIKILSSIYIGTNPKLYLADLLNNNFSSVSIARQNPFQAIDQLSGKEYLSEKSMEIDVNEYLENPNDFRLIDIREEFDFELNPSPGENIPYHILLDNKEGALGDKPVLLVCETGKKSVILAKKLNENGSVKFLSLRGGINSNIQNSHFVTFVNSL